VLSFLKVDHQIYRYFGATKPLGAPMLKGDDAHGDDGIGGIKLDDSEVAVRETPSHEFILSTLDSEAVGTVTITATGPLTNIAQAFLEAPDVMEKVKVINVMGGCTVRMPAHDMDFRQGNITPSSEFNFFMASHDAKTVMNSGLPINLFPMNCTHQLVFTPERKQTLLSAFDLARDIGGRIADLISVPAALDRMKFDSDPVMHDVHTALQIVAPDQYIGRQGYVDVVTCGDNMGKTSFHEAYGGNVRVMESLADPDQLYNVVVDSFASIFKNELT